MTTTLMIRYKTHDAQAAENEALVRGVFDELRARGPAGLRYETYRLADGATFVHLVKMQDRDRNPLTATPAFQAFQKNLKARCVEAPVVTEWVAVDSYTSASSEGGRGQRP